MKKLCLSLLAAIFACPIFCQGIIDNDNNHDIRSLRAWGPYTKRYAGISHIPDMERGVRFDFSVMPGYYRNRQLVPHVLFESSYYPWEINPEMDRITYRYELEWKDRVYVDVTYNILDEQRTLVEMRCVNNTDINQNLVLNNIAYIDYPEREPEVKAEGAEGLTWHNAVHYIANEPVNKTPQYGLVYDGWNRNEERTPQSLDGSVLARDLGKDKGHRLVYEINIPEGQENGMLAFRFKMHRGDKVTYDASGLVTGPVNFEGIGDFTFLEVPYTVQAPGRYKLELVSQGGKGMQLDGFFVGKTEDFKSLRVVPCGIPFVPSIERGKDRQDFILKYADAGNYYGVAWNFRMSEIREIQNGELESFFRKKVHDHVSSTLWGDRHWHYTNAFLRPIVLAPGSEEVLYTLLSTGTKDEVARDMREFHESQDRFIARIRKPADTKDNYLPESQAYRFGNQLLQAAILSNIVYPVYTQRQFIRHFTPGMNWNSLYTWDSGFISLGLIDVDPEKAYETVKAYTTPVGSESAFIHHGTPLPIQMFAFIDLWNNDMPRDSMAVLYPRLKQFFDFMAGNKPHSSTRMKGSGLLRSWDYFYNSGGWDDYPPQKARKTRDVTPVVTSAYYLRAAKILRLAARELGEKADVKYYDGIIKKLGHALQEYSWDPDAGYFGYVLHDGEGNPTGTYRYGDGTNFNKGLDGVSPLAAGICTPAQTEELVGHIFSAEELWTNVGISTVDQSAPYYREDGYWNGAVWFPHQWVMWKALLDNGKGKEAYKVAVTAMKTWEKECSASYHTFEHFIVSSERGAGWHQFSGLSSNLLNWYAAYYKIGKVSAGFEIWINDDKFDDDFTAYEARLVFDDATRPHERTMILIMDPAHKYKASFSGKSVPVESYYPGMVEITLPATNRSGKLIVSAVE